MYTKIAVFGVISALLGAAIYSSSAYFVFGVTDTVCVQTSKTTTFCQVIENDKVSSWDCKKNPDGKTWRCDQVKAITGDSIPPDLTDALDVVTEGSQNNTKVPKAGILEDGAPLTQGDTSDDNVAFSCQYSAGGTKADCINLDEDGDYTRWACEKLQDGNWTCVKVQQTSMPPEPELNDALNDAIAQGGVKSDVKPDTSVDEGEDANDDTEVPEDRGGLNDDDDGAPTINPGQ